MNAAHRTPAAAFLSWPFFAAHHRTLVQHVDEWARAHVRHLPPDASRTELDAHCRRTVAALGAAGLLRHSAPVALDDAPPSFDVRAIALLRERLAWHDGLADFACAMQGLGSGAISLAGTPAQRAAYLPGVAAGTRVAAFVPSTEASAARPFVAARQSRAMRRTGNFITSDLRSGISEHFLEGFPFHRNARTPQVSPVD